MVEFQTIVTYGLAFVLPVLIVIYRRSSSSTPPPASLQTEPEEEKKPLKSIMQPPTEDLAPPKDDPFTPEELALYDGTHPDKGIYVAIKGTIFDVTRKADVYGPGKSYHIFAGKDGSRGLGMSSLKTEHAVPDYSTLNESESKVLDDWYGFFSKRYSVVGRVVPSASASGSEVPPAAAL